MANKLDGFRPIGDLILIKRDESLKMTKGGLYLPEQSQEQLCTGYVVAVGEGNFHKGERIPVRGGGRIFSYDDDEDGNEDVPFDDIARAAPEEGEDGEE